MMARIILLSVLVLQATLFGADAVVPDVEGRTRQIVERALEQYRVARSYEDKLVIGVEVDAEGDESAVPKGDRWEVTLAWSRPNRIAWDTPVFGVFSDGKKLWQQLKPLEQVVESAAGGRIDLAGLELSRFGMYERLRHPIALVLGREDASATDLLGKVLRFTGARAEPLAGRPGQWVSCVVEYEMVRGKTAAIPCDAWFSDETGLAGEIRYDYADWIRNSGAIRGLSDGRVKLNACLERFRFEQRRLNETIADDRFAFKPGPYDEQVAQFRPLDERQYQLKLVGRPAPDFGGKDLQGKPLMSADLKGRVVLLDFWASWCGPCLMVMPSIQKLAERFADKPVSVIGINGDGPGQARVVASVLERQKITYRQYMDVDKKVFTAYRVQPIPCLFLIDKKGVIQAVHAGFAPGDDERLAQMIEKLLSGEDLFVPRKPVAGG